MLTLAKLSSMPTNLNPLSKLQSLWTFVKDRFVKKNFSENHANRMEYNNTKILGTEDPTLKLFRMEQLHSILFETDFTKEHLIPRVLDSITENENYSHVLFEYINHYDPSAATYASLRTTIIALYKNIIHAKAAKGDTAAYAAQDDLRSTLTGSGKRKLDHDKCKDCGKKHGGQQCWKKRPHLAPKWFVKMLIDQGELPRNFLDQKNGKFDKSGNANKPGNKSDNKKFKPLPRPNPKASNCALCNSAQHTTAKCSGNAFRKGFKYCTECNSAGHKATNCPNGQM